MDLQSVITGLCVSGEAVINLNDIKLKGNVLDAGIENNGIIYNLFKKNNEEVSVDYVEKGENRKEAMLNFYDTAVLFLTLSSLTSEKARKALITEMLKYIKSDGEIVVWDINKKRGKLYKLHIKVVMPGEKIRNIKMSNMNIISDASLDKTTGLVRPYFDIIELKAWDNIYYIRGRRKES